MHLFMFVPYFSVLFFPSSFCFLHSSRTVSRDSFFSLHLRNSKAGMEHLLAWPMEAGVSSNTWRTTVYPSLHHMNTMACFALSCYNSHAVITMGDGTLVSFAANLSSLQVVCDCLNTCVYKSEKPGQARRQRCGCPSL